jgi:gliding motility-associated protein GldE
MAYPLRVLDKVFSPISLPMRGITLGIHRRLGKQKSNISVDQLSQALELTSEEDTTKEEQKILQGIVSFGNTDTKQVMKPRMDIFALNVEQSYKEIIPEVIEKGYSRIPVFEESIDNVQGILYVKDLLPYLHRKVFDWTTLLREPYFVPENKKLDDLLNEFKDKKNHLAIVVDEYGGTSGLISLEDIIEEIVGDIDDEHDVTTQEVKREHDGSFILDGSETIRDLNREYDWGLPDEEAATLAGLILHESRRIPQVGQSFMFHEFRFDILKRQRHQITSVRVTPTSP